MVSPRRRSGSVRGSVSPCPRDSRRWPGRARRPPTLMKPLTVGKRHVVGHKCAVDRPRYVNRIHHIAKALGEPVGDGPGGRKGTGELRPARASRVIRPTRLPGLRPARPQAPPPLRDKTVGQAKPADHAPPNTLPLPLPGLALRSRPSPSEATVLTDRGIGRYEHPCLAQAE